VTDPLVSVVVPAYNAATTIGETLASILEQNVRDLEVLVVDDGSSDGTRDVVAQVADERVRLITQENGGAASARNTGIGEAAGHFIAFLDADDLWAPGKLSRHLAYLDAHPHLGVVQTGAVYVDPDLRVLEVRRSATTVDAVLETLRFENMPAFPSTVVMRRSALDQLGGFDPSLVILEDWDFVLRSARAGLLGTLPEPLTLYRVHPGNRSRDLGIHVEPGERILADLFADPELPPEILEKRSEIYARLRLMLAGGSIRSREPLEALRWLARALADQPKVAPYVLAMPFRRAGRRLTRARRAIVDVAAGPCESCGAVVPLRSKRRTTCGVCRRPY
jgi:glycosyltransferase involved in cell wall biosynthesis